MRLLCAALFVVGCSAPNYGNGHLQCAPGRVCPSGFYCAADDHCWVDGSGPPPDEDLGVNGGNDLAPAITDLASLDLAPAPSKCGGLTGVILCDGFENPIGLIGWTAGGSNGLASQDTSRFYRGASSLHSHISGAPAMAAPFAVIHRSDIFPFSGTLYVRVWVYFTSGLPASFDQFLNFADNSSTGFSVATDQTRVALNDYAGGIYQNSATLVPLDRWACVQFEVQQGSPSGAIRVRVDGTLLSDLPQNGLTTIAVNGSLGLDFYGNNVAIPVYDAWFDEIIIDNKPTTCDE